MVICYVEKHFKDKVYSGEQAELVPAPLDLGAKLRRAGAPTRVLSCRAMTKFPRKWLSINICILNFPPWFVLFYIPKLFCFISVSGTKLEVGIWKSFGFGRRKIDPRIWRSEGDRKCFWFPSSRICWKQKWSEKLTALRFRGLATNLTNSLWNNDERRKYQMGPFFQ